MLIFLDFLLKLVTPLPVRTDRTLTKIPYVTYSLLIINILVHLFTLSLSEVQLQSFHHAWGFIPNESNFVTLFTHSFLHGGLMHLVGNMLLLWIVGTVLESGIGSILFLMLYAASTIAAALLNAVITQIFVPSEMGIVLIGASGAISGVLGYATFRYYHLRVMTILLLFGIIPIWFFWFPFWTYGAYFVVTNIISGVSALLDPNNSGSVAYWAHIGGFGIGMLAALLLKSGDDGKRENIIENSARVANRGERTYSSIQEVWDQLKKNPTDPELLEALAGLLLVEGQVEQSRDYYLRAVTQFQALRQPDRAAISYLNVLHNFPTTALPLRDQMNVAAALERSGHFAESIQSFTLVSELYPDTEEAQTAMLRTSAILSRYFHDDDKAKEILQELIRRYPNSTWCDMAKERLKSFEKRMGLK